MGCILPLSEKEAIPEHFGTRHRAALGITELTDAVCIVVSEERAEVSTVVQGKVTTWEKPELLASGLSDLLTVPETLVKDMAHFSIDPDLLRAYRSRVAEAIDAAGIPPAEPWPQ